MKDSDLPEHSRKRSFFDEDSSSRDARNPISRDKMDRGEMPPHPNQPYPNNRERMASRYREEEEEEEDYEDSYDQRNRSRFSFLQGLLHGDSSTRRLGFAAAGIGGVLLLFIGGWMVFHSGHQGIPVIEPPKQAAKEKPFSDGTGTTIGMGKIDGQSGVNGQPTLAPGPEQANRVALMEQYGAGGNPANGQTGSSQTANNSVANNPGGSSVSANGGVPVMARGIAGNQGSSMAKPSQVSQGAKLEESSGEAEADQEARPVAPAPVKPRHKAVIQKNSVIKKASRQEESGKARNGHYVVQLAALGSSQAAEKQWQVMRKKVPAILGKYTPSIQKVEVKGNVIYRVRIKGFASKAQANSFCSQLKAKSLSCTFANF